MGFIKEKRRVIGKITCAIKEADMERIGIIGAGNMGEAILKAIIKAGTDKGGIIVKEIDPEKARLIYDRYGIRCVDSLDELVLGSRYIFICIKPQDSKPLLKGIGHLIDNDKVIISIMAGITISRIISIIGKTAKIVRVMPNLCIKVGEGVVGITANEGIDKEGLDYLRSMLSPLGIIIEVDEGLMDTITAIGGSGPAFLLFFLEAMIDAGVKCGLSRERAKIISLQVAKGTLKMLEEEGLHPAIMKEMVTSPAGTTIEGLTILEEDGIKGKIIRAIERSKERARELSV